jgi:hypothetical protein
MRSDFWVRSVKISLASHARWIVMHAWRWVRSVSFRGSTFFIHCPNPWQRFLVSLSCIEGLLNFGAVKTQDPLGAQPERFVYPNDLKGTALGCINPL